MKTRPFIISFIFLALTANAFGQAGMSARQFFLTLPNEYAVGTAKEKAAYLIFPRSIKKDFLTFMLSGKAVPQNIARTFQQPEALGDLRVFRGAAKTIIGLSYQAGDGKESSPTTDTTRYTTFLLENRAGKWTDVTGTMLPTVSADEAFDILSKDFQMTGLKKENVWVETQVSKDRSGLIVVARIKGNDSVTILRTFDWKGGAFVERTTK